MVCANLETQDASILESMREAAYAGRWMIHLWSFQVAELFTADISHLLPINSPPRTDTITLSKLGNYGGILHLQVTEPLRLFHRGDEAVVQHWWLPICSVAYVWMEVSGRFLVAKLLRF